MSQLQPKQLKKILSGVIKITGLSVSSSASSVNVTTQLTSALTTAGEASSSVPLIASTSSADNGVVVTSPNNRCEVWDATTKAKIAVGTAEVYAKLSFGSSVYTLNFYYLNAAGAEIAYTFTGAATIDFDFAYRYRFHEFPADGFIAYITKNVMQDTQGSSAVEVNEKLAVTSTNTVAALSATPAYVSRTKLIVNGKVETPLGASPAFTISGTTLTWSPVNAGYTLETTDDVSITFYV
jgi:hypothetical protein